MNLYEVALATLAAAAGAAGAELQAVGRPLNLLELEISNTAATAASIILGRPGNTPAGGALTVGTLPINQPPDAVASGGGITTTWSTAPTVPAAGNQHRRIVLPATIGAGVVWQWNPGEMIVGSTRTRSLILWNFGAAAWGAGGLQARFKFEE